MSSAYGVLGDFWRGYTPQVIPGSITRDVLSGGKPHPRSYRPDLPFARQTREVWSNGGKTAEATASLLAYVDRIVKEEAQKLAVGVEPATACVKDHLSEIPAGNKPHPRSYRPDLPMHGFTVAQLVGKPTKDDKAEWNARPLKYDPTSTGPHFEDGYRGVTSQWTSGRAP